MARTVKPLTRAQRAYLKAFENNSVMRKDHLNLVLAEAGMVRQGDPHSGRKKNRATLVKVVL